MKSNEFFGDEFSAMLEDYHYGELDDVTAARVMAHLRGCNQCSSMLAGLEQENNIYQAYADTTERNLEITPAMWENVRSRIAEVAPDSPGLFARLRNSLSSMGAAVLPTSPVMRQVAFAAVIIVISVTGTLLAVKYFQSNQSPGQEAHNSAPQPAPAPQGAPKPNNPQDKTVIAGNSEPNHEEPAPKKRPEKNIDKNQFVPVNNVNETHPKLTPDEMALDQRIQKLRLEYVEAIDLLNAKIDKRKSKLDPKLVAVFNRNLTIVNETIAATRKAYESN